MEQNNNAWWQEAAVKPVVEEKWYNNKLKLGLSILFWPLLIYGLYKTDLITKRTKLIFAALITLTIGLRLLAGPGEIYGKYEPVYSEQAEELGLVAKNYDNHFWVYKDGRIVLHVEGLFGSGERIGRYEFDKKNSVLNVVFEDGLGPYKIDMIKETSGWRMEYAGAVYKQK